MRLSRFASLLFALLASHAPAATPENAVALLPFENLTNFSEAPSRIARGISAALAKKGWRVVEGAPVEAALDQARVRYIDSLESGVRPKVAEALGTSVLAFGSVFAFDQAADPRVAFAVRLVTGDGRVLFSDLVSLREEDAEGIFEFGKPVPLDELAAEAMGRIGKRLPRPGTAASRPASRALPVHLPAPRTVRSASLSDGARHRVVVLPFANAGPHEAARIVAELFGRRLAASSLLDVVDPADLRAAVVAEKIHDLSDPAERIRLGKRIGTSLYLTGTIYEFRESHQASSDTPHLEMEVRLTDAATGEILWTSYASRLGTDYRGLLQLGEITGIVGLADQSAAEMIRSVEKARPVAATRQATAPTPASPAVPDVPEEKGKTR